LLSVSFVVAQQQRGKYPDQKATFCHRSTRLSDFGQHIERSDIKGERRSIAKEQGDTIGRPHPNQKGIVVSSPQNVFPEDFRICRG
jgi:hypothetical protein